MGYRDVPSDDGYARFASMMGELQRKVQMLLERPASSDPAPPVTTPQLPIGATVDVLVGITPAVPGMTFLPLDGSAVSRTTYATLFAGLGTFYGAGDGSTTFNLPDARDKVAVGHGGSLASPTGGEASHTLLAGESGLPSHAHTEAAAGAHSHTPDVGGNFAVNAPSGNTADFIGGAAYTIRPNTNTAGSHSHTINAAGPADAASPHNNVQPYFKVAKWVRAL